MFTETCQGNSYSYYLLGDGSYGGSASDSDANNYGLSSPVGATGSGAITATFTWKPDGPGDDPPKSVIIQQYSNVTSFCECVGPQGGSDDGLGGSPYEVPIYDGHGFTILWSFCSSTTWMVKSDPGASFTETCSPSAGYTGVLGQDDGVPENSFAGDASADITYKATAYPVTIDIIGGVGPTDSKHFLIGQQVYATLNKGGLPDFPTDTYNWSVDGGKPFDNYSANVGSAHYYPLFSTQPNTGQSVLCYFAKPDPSVTFTCNANLAGQSITVTKQIRTEKPSSEVAVEIGSVQDEGDLSNPYGMILTGLSLPNNPGIHDIGIRWTNNVLTPIVFSTPAPNILDPTAVDPGQWNWTQLTIPGRQIIDGGVTEQIALMNTTPPTKIYGLECLDNVYPYSTSVGQPFGSDGWYPADNSPNGDSDAPEQTFPFSASVTEVNVLDSFRDYLMYLPPGGNSVVVPLKRVKWFWKGNGSQSDNVWSTSGEDAQWSFDGDFPDHPEWNFAYVNNSSNFVP